MSIATIAFTGSIFADGNHPGACDLTTDPIAHTHEQWFDEPWECLAPLVSEITPSPVPTLMPEPTATPMVIPTQEPKLYSSFDTRIVFRCVLPMINFQIQWDEVKCEKVDY